MITKAVTHGYKGINASLFIDKNLVQIKSNQTLFIVGSLQHDKHKLCIAFYRHNMTLIQDYNKHMHTFKT